MATTSSSPLRHSSLLVKHVTVEAVPTDNLIPMPCDLVVWALGIRAPATRSGFERSYFFVPCVLPLSRENMEFPVQEGKPTAAQ
ncbi:hypothetical protein Peur_024169 [Populus x canadensis]